MKLIDLLIGHFPKLIKSGNILSEVLNYSHQIFAISSLVSSPNELNSLRSYFYIYCDVLI